MKQILILFGLMIGGCATSSTSSTPFQDILSPTAFYKDVPGVIVVDKTKITGTYDNGRGFGSGGIEIKEEGTFRRWKPGLWDGSKNINYQDTNWTFQGGLLTLKHNKTLSKTQQEVFDVVAFEDRIFLVPVDERENFIAKVREHELSIASTDQHVISFESLTESYLSKPDDL